MVITGAWSGLCKLWSVPNSDCIRTLRGHTDRVGGVCFHPQSTLTQDKSSLNIASGGADANIHLWNLERYVLKPLITLENIDSNIPT